MRVLTLPGVFKPRSDSWMLAAHVARAPLRTGARVLELCPGSGIAAVAAARRGCDVTAVDVSRRAVLTATANARLNGTRVRAVRGDLLAPLDGRSFHLIAANPPYLPGNSGDLPGSGPERAWEGGSDGRTLLDRILAAAPPRLEPGGVLLLVHSSVCGEEETLAPCVARDSSPRSASVAAGRSGHSWPTGRRNSPRRACSETGSPRRTSWSSPGAVRPTRGRRPSPGPRSGAPPRPALPPGSPARRPPARR